jgi:hypothetical protein
MKIAKSKLKQIIKEEIKNVLNKGNSYLFEAVSTKKSMK